MNRLDDWRDQQTLPKAMASILLQFKWSSQRAPEKTRAAYSSFTLMVRQTSGPKYTDTKKRRNKE